ncbi:hypothetical protein [Chitiniphilus shinanonensis]|uniref:hypothetical protein n=1 Tax=Chitiniphilus shinanonensis TaxID=553088 RepID=UPI00305FEC2E
MTEQDDSVSPLFNKMDALMARHRGSGAGTAVEEDIPVLTEMLDDDIPVLTEVIAAKPAEPPADEGLMFHPDDFLPPPRQPQSPPPASPVAQPAAASPSVFLDLPLLDLDALLADPAPFGPVEDTAMPQGEPPPAEAPVAEAAAEEIDYPTLEWEDDEAVGPAPAPTEAPEALDEIAATPSVAGFEVIEHGDDALPIEFVDPTPEHQVTVLELIDEIVEETAEAPAPIIADTPTAPAFVAAPEPPIRQPEAAPYQEAEAVPPPPQPLPPTSWNAPAPIEAPAEDHWASAADLRIELAEEPAIELDLDPHLAEPPAVPAIPAPAWMASALVEPAATAQPVVTPAAEAPRPTLPPPAPKLDESAIAELTAGVAATLAVDIAMEVDRLSRQHFKTLMSTLYAEAAQTLATQIGHELEARLAPRVAELVRDELRRRNLLD